MLPWTAIQSFKSSPGGRRTAALRLIPELSEAWAWVCRPYLNVPGSNFFLGLKVCKKNNRNSYYFTNDDKQQEVTAVATKQYFDYISI